MASRLIKLAVSVVMCGSLVLASDSLILLDRSGSMKRYYESGLARNLADRIQRSTAAVEPPDLEMFDVNVVKIQSLDSPEFTSTHNDTYLTAALSEGVREHKRIWVLTDNVQDEAGSQDMANFYALLQSDEIRYIYIFPLRQHPGSQGLLIYAISTEQSPEILNRQVSAFRAATTDLQLTELPMKPLGENVIRVELASNEPKFRFNEGQVLRFSSHVRIGPKFPHLYFEASQARGGTLRTPFSDSSCLESEKSESSISPEMVRTNEVRDYQVSVDFGRVRLRRTFHCIWQAAFNRSHESQEIQTPVEIHVPQSNFRLAKSFLTEFTAATPAESFQSGKIAGLQHLPEFLAPRETIVPVRVPASLTVSYPSWPAFLLFVVVAFLAGVLYFLIRAIVVGLSNTHSTKVWAESIEGKPMYAELQNKAVWIGKDMIGTSSAHSFTPGPGIRLDPATRVASTLGPIIAVLPNGVRVRFGFGRRPAINGATATTTGTRLGQVAKQSTPVVLKKR